MDGIHDLGGMDGLGPLPEKDDGLFHETWEAKVDGLASVLIGLGHWGAPDLRHGRARLEPAYYLSSTYDGRKLGATEMLAIENGLVTEDELFARIAELGTAERYEDGLPHREDPAQAERVRTAHLHKPGDPAPPGDPAFAEGDTVRVRNMHPAGHTRCPRYVRRAVGTVVDVHGLTELPDAAVGGDGRLDQLYSVDFDAGELWGSDHPERHDVTLNLWEHYLEEP